MRTFISEVGEMRRSLWVSQKTSFRVSGDPLSFDDHIWTTPCSLFPIFAGFFNQWPKFLSALSFPICQLFLPHHGSGHQSFPYFLPEGAHGELDYHRTRTSVISGTANLVCRRESQVCFYHLEPFVQKSERSLFFHGLIGGFWEVEEFQIPASAVMLCFFNLFILFTESATHHLHFVMGCLRHEFDACNVFFDSCNLFSVLAYLLSERCEPARQVLDSF